MRDRDLLLHFWDMWSNICVIKERFNITIFFEKDKRSLVGILCNKDLVRLFNRMEQLLDCSFFFWKDVGIFYVETTKLRE